MTIGALLLLIPLAVEKKNVEFLANDLFSAYSKMYCADVLSEETPPCLYGDTLLDFERARDTLVKLQDYDYWFNPYGSLVKIHQDLSHFLECHVYERNPSSLSDPYVVSEAIFGPRLKWISQRRILIRKQVTYRNWLKNRTEKARDYIGDFADNTIWRLIDCAIDTHDRLQRNGK